MLQDLQNNPVTLIEAAGVSNESLSEHPVVTPTSVSSLDGLLSKGQSITDLIWSILYRFLDVVINLVEASDLIWSPWLSFAHPRNTFHGDETGGCCHGPGP